MRLSATECLYSWLLRGFASSSLSGLCPWTPLWDFRLPNPLFPPSFQALDTPLQCTGSVHWSCQRSVRSEISVSPTSSHPVFFWFWWTLSIDGPGVHVPFASWVIQQWRCSQLSAGKPSPFTGVVFLRAGWYCWRLANGIKALITNVHITTAPQTAVSTMFVRTDQNVDQSETSDVCHWMTFQNCFGQLDPLGIILCNQFRVGRLKYF